MEDHEIYVTQSGASIRYFPSEQKSATIAYEDNWPHQADYDMNDVVIQYHVTEVFKDQSVKKILVKGALLAYGADYHNGFAIRLQGIAREDIDLNLTRLYHNGERQLSSGLEMDANEPIFIISNDLSVVKSQDCPFYRTIDYCETNVEFHFDLHISLEANTDTQDLPAMPYDPFIFATPNFYHGEQLPFQPGRTWEVHLVDIPPTEKFNASELWGLGVDASSDVDGRYFKTDQNLPWAILIPDEWNWPKERVDVVTSYPRFKTFAESAGSLDKNWYKAEFANQQRVYQP